MFYIDQGAYVPSTPVDVANSSRQLCPVDVAPLATAKWSCNIFDCAPAQLLAHPMTLESMFTYHQAAGRHWCC
jgi:hypothetical protein